ncbi:hypothetical protein QBC43DRAFT_288040 [Cladorrhinum sp. PSN259]|nr:hypothetical protein QBC43DRAFT_288040 [Cladorrhinum sp. PSN259]
MDTQPLFGLIITSQPVTTQPTQVLSPTSFLYAIPPISSVPSSTSSSSAPESKPWTHVTIFLLPGITLPPNTGAAIYTLSNPPSPGTEKFVGAIGPGKESIILKIGTKETVYVGIVLEPAGTLLQKMAAKEAALVSASSSTAIKGVEGGKEENVLLGLAEKVIGNAFNYLASFSVDNRDGRGVMVPLKAFEEWWKKFQSKARTDPKFLERGN